MIKKVVGLIIIVLFYTCNSEKENVAKRLNHNLDEIEALIETIKAEKYKYIRISIKKNKEVLLEYGDSIKNKKVYDYNIDEKDNSMDKFINSCVKRLNLIDVEEFMYNDKEYFLFNWDMHDRNYLLYPLGNSSINYRYYDFYGSLDYFISNETKNLEPFAKKIDSNWYYFRLNTTI